MLVNVAHGDRRCVNSPTSPGHQVAVGNRTLQFNNTNRLVKNPSWDIGLQKPATSRSGECLATQTKVAGRKLIMVFWTRPASSADWGTPNGYGAGRGDLRAS